MEDESFRDHLSTVTQEGKRIWVYPKKQKGKFRSFYKNIIDLILNNRTEIEGFIKGTLGKKILTKKTKFNRRHFTKKTRKYRK